MKIWIKFLERNFKLKRVFKKNLTTNLFKEILKNRFLEELANYFLQ